MATASQVQTIAVSLFATQAVLSFSNTIPIGFCVWSQTTSVQYHFGSQKGREEMYAKTKEDVFLFGSCLHGSGQLAVQVVAEALKTSATEELHLTQNDIGDVGAQAPGAGSAHHKILFFART